jgi:hypothetical protein
MVDHICNPSTQEAEARGLKFQASLGYIVKLHLKERGRERGGRERGIDGGRERSGREREKEEGREGEKW